MGFREALQLATWGFARRWWVELAGAGDVAGRKGNGDGIVGKDDVSFSHGSEPNNGLPGDATGGGRKKHLWSKTASLEALGGVTHADSSLNLGNSTDAGGTDLSYLLREDLRRVYEASIA